MIREGEAAPGFEGRVRKVSDKVKVDGHAHGLLKAFEGA